MSCVRFLTDNFIEQDRLAAEYVSSEATAYQVENLYDQYRRTKVWRSSGYWKLDDLTIVFREQVGVDITATLAADEYFSDATFLSAIQTALIAAGAANYLVERNTTTNKIQITSDLSGGATVFQLRMEAAASADMANAMGYDTVAYTGAAFYQADLLRIHSYEFIKWDMGIPTNPKAFVFTDDRNQPLVITEQAVIKLQGNETDSWSAPSYEASIDYNDFLLYLSSDTGLHTSALRYWRLYIQDYANPNGYIQGGVAYLGDSVVFDRGSAQFPLSQKKADTSTTVFAEAGQAFVDRFPLVDELSLEFKFLTKEDAETFDLIYQLYGSFKPFFMSLDESAVFSSDNNIWVKMVRMDKSPDKLLVSPNNFSVNLSLKEVL